MAKEKAHQIVSLREAAILRRERFVRETATNKRFTQANVDRFREEAYPVFGCVLISEVDGHQENIGYFTIYHKPDRSISYRVYTMPHGHKHKQGIKNGIVSASKLGSFVHDDLLAYAFHAAKLSQIKGAKWSYPFVYYTLEERFAHRGQVNTLFFRNKIPSTFFMAGQKNEV